jgi:hypothetical protein
MKHRLTAAGITLGLAFTASLGTTSAQAARPVERAATSPVVVAKMSESAITLSASSMRAGKITFKVVNAKAKGSAVMQLLRLHAGYTLPDLGADIGMAFGGPGVTLPDQLAAIGRLDDNVTWLSGASATQTRPGWFNISLAKGTYVVIDQDNQNPVFTQLNVHGTTVKRTAPSAHGASIITYTYGFDTTGVLPHDGWVRTTNKADQPHFIVASRVKDGTTAKQVAAFIKSGAQGQPSWALKANSGLGVISPGKTGLWKIQLPKGEYLLQCFWPDRMDGAPHFFHGMWQLVHLH